MNLIQPSPLEISDDGKTKEKVLVLIGAIVLVAAGFYFFGSGSGINVVPKEQQENFGGVVSKIVADGFEITQITSAGEVKKSFAVAEKTLFYSLDLSKKDSQELPKSFSDVKEGSDIAIVFVKENGVNKLVKVILPILPAPPARIKDSPTRPPGGAGNSPSSENYQSKNKFGIISAAQANHYGGSGSYSGVSISVGSSGSGQSPDGSINVNTSLSNNYTNYYWGMWLYGHIGNLIQQSTWVAGYGTGKSASFNFSNLSAGNYNTGGDSYMYWWGNSKWNYWATLSKSGSTINIPNPPPPPFDYSFNSISPRSVVRGSSVGFPVSINLTSGNTQGVTFLASGVSGTSFSFSPPSCNPSCSTTLTVSPGANVSAGNYTVTVSGSPLGHSTSFTLTVLDPFDYALANSGGITVNQGGSGSSTITINKTSGASQLVSLSISGVPSGASSKFSLANNGTGGLIGDGSGGVTCVPNNSCSSTLTISTSGSINPGTYPITITGSPNGRTTTFNLVVNPPPFSYSLANSGNISMARGSSGSNTVTVAKISGTAQNVTLSAGGLPYQASTSFLPASCLPNSSCSSALTISTSAQTPTGNYTVTISGSPSGGTTSFDLNVLAPPTADIKIRTASPPSGQVSDSSVNISYNTAAYLTWSSTNATSCTITGGSQSWSGTSNSAGQSTGNLTADKTYSITCTGSGGTSPTDSVTANVAAPTLSTNFSVTPTSGNSPLDTTFSNSVSGSAQGTINYNYWWDCGYNSTSVAGIEYKCGALPQITPGSCAANANGYKCLAVNTNPHSITHQYTCASGTCSYNAKTIVERSSASPVQQIVPVSVSLPVLTASCSPEKTKTTKGEGVAWISSISGGTGSYVYSWGGSAPLAGKTTSPISVAYTSSGVKTGSLTVTSGSQSKTVNCSGSVDVKTPGIKVAPSSASIKVDDTSTLLAYYYPYGINDTSGIQDITSDASWSSNNNNVATVNDGSQKGLVTGESVGTANIYANYTDQYGNVVGTSVNNGTTAAVTVTSQPILSCSPSSSNTLTGQDITFSASGGTQSYNWTASGGSPASGSGSSFVTKFNNPNTYNVVVKSGRTQSATCSVIVSSPTLSVSLEAKNPSGGNAPVNDVNLKATVTASNVSGSTRYVFYCNRSDAGTNITNPSDWDKTVTDNPYEKGDLCDYGSPGTYTAKIIAVRGTGSSEVKNEARTTITVNPPPSVDIKADSSDGPITIDSDNSAVLSWTSQNVDGCTASGNGPGWSGGKATTERGVSTGVFTQPGTFTYTLKCTNNSTGASAENSVVINVNPSLSISSFTVEPPGKPTPGNRNNMSVAIASNLTGVNNNYTFYCNKPGSPDTDTTITGDWSHKKDNIPDMSYFAQGVCDYSGAGTYRAKVIVERGSMARAAHVDITILPNVAPTVSALPPAGPDNYCTAPFGWALNWTFADGNGDTQSAYQVVITDSASGNTVKDTGQVTSSSNSYAVPLSTLDFNKTYNWTIKVWESDPARLTAQAGGSSFTTLKHSAPALSFNVSPLRPSKDEQVTITDTTTVTGGATKTNWNWDLTGVTGITLLGPTNASELALKFSTSGTKNIKLRVTDSDGLVCEKGSNDDANDGMPSISIGRSVPSFKEVLPR